MADISLQGISKAYGATAALDDISLEVADGELSVQLECGGFRVIMNGDMPWRSTAYYRASEVSGC